MAKSFSTASHWFLSAFRSALASASLSALRESASLFFFLRCIWGVQGESVSE